MNSEQDAVDIFYINCWTFQMFCTCLHAFESALRIHQIFSTEDVNERVSQVEHLLHEIDEMEEDFRVLEDDMRHSKWEPGLEGESSISLYLAFTVAVSGTFWPKLFCGLLALSGNTWSS